jgi:hypothetical protein
LLVENYSNSPGGQTYSAATRIFIGLRANMSSSNPVLPVFAFDLKSRFDACSISGWCFRQRPYFVEYTRSHPNSEVKRRKARSVLGWGTAREALRVLLAFSVFGYDFESRFDACSISGWCFRQRPYFVEYTRSHPNSEVKRRKARSVLGWGTAREALRVLLAFSFCFWLVRLVRRWLAA